MKYTIGLLSFFMSYFFCETVQAQEAQAFNAIYQKAYLEIAPQDMDRAQTIADSLYIISTTPLFRTKSLMLSATLHEHKNQLEKSIQIAEQAYEIIRPTREVSWKVRICGFLATQYRLLQLYKKSKIFCDQALELIPQIPQPEAARSAAGLVHQELAFYYMAAKNHQLAIDHIYMSQRSFEQVNQNKYFFQANNEQLLGLNYYYLDQSQKALAHYRKSLELTKNMTDNHVRGLTYNGLCNIYIQQADLPKAKKYLDSATAIADHSKHLQLKNAILKTTQKYYLKVKDMANFEKASKKQDSVSEQISLKKARFLDSSFIELEKNTWRAQQSSDAKNLPIAAGTLMLICGGFYLYFHRRKQKQQHELFRAYFDDKKHINILPKGKPSEPGHTFFENIESVEVIVVGSDSLDEQVALTDNNQKRDTNPMPSEETVQRLLDNLHNFEKQLQFISGTITLSQLAVQFNTNVRYLSSVIKIYKERDFNGYINELRVDYIVRQLKENLQWRTYKISVLAEKAGFSSHGKFTTIFKGITGLSPSVFIRHLGN